MRTFGRGLAAGLLAAFLISPLRADDISNNLSSHLNSAALDALAQDIGTVMGGGSFHQGKVLGFPLGFDVGIHVPVVRVQDDNVIIKDDGSTLQALWGQLEIGLPGRLNVLARYGKFYDGNVYGGGLKLGLLKSVVPAIPSISISGLYSQLDHDLLKGNTLSANLALSFDVPFVHPYVGAGYDFTRIEPTDLVYTGAASNVPRGQEGESGGYRTEVGVNLSVVPFTYITIGGGIANSNSYYHAGAGVKF